MAKELSLEDRLDRIIRELVEIKKATFPLKKVDKEKSATAWSNLLRSADAITAAWSGPSAVDEIKNQREKVW